MSTSADPRAYYDRFSRSYNERRGHGYHALIDELEAAAIPDQAGLRILEAGCGTGLVMNRLRQRGAAHLVGVDLSSGMLQQARQGGHTVAQGSVTALPFADASFDVVYCFKVLAHVPDIRLALAEFGRVLRPGGTMVVEFYNRRSLRGLRWKLKQAIGGERTGARQRETDLYTRYDSVADMIDYLPPDTAVQEIRGAVVVTPAAVAMSVPGLSSLLQAVERAATRSTMARYAGFVMLIARRL
jgi:ubiquinone/menaquinone biosynthesis C-methylase UbiE